MSRFSVALGLPQKDDRGRYMYPAGSQTMCDDCRCRIEAGQGMYFNVWKGEGFTHNGALCLECMDKRDALSPLQVGEQKP